MAAAKRTYTEVFKCDVTVQCVYIYCSTSCTKWRVPSVPLRAHAHKLTMIGLEEWRARMGAWDAVKGGWFVRWPFARSINIAGIILMNN